MRLAPKRRSRIELSLEGELGNGFSRIFFTRSGRTEFVRFGMGAPLILLPSLAGGWQLLMPLARSLARSHEVIVPGLVGDDHRAPSHRTVGEYARDLLDLIEELRFERPAVFGASFGAAIALEAAVESPGAFGSLALYGAEATFHSGLGFNILHKVLQRYPLPSDSPFFNQFFNILHGCRPECEEMARFIVGRCWETGQGAVVGRLDALEAFDVADRLWRLDVPALVMAGTRDVVVPPAHQQALASAISGCHFESIPGAGHVGFLTHRDEVVRHVNAMLRAPHRSAR